MRNSETINIGKRSQTRMVPVPWRWWMLLLVALAWLPSIGFNPSVAAADTDLTVDVKGGRLTIMAEKVQLKEILDGIYDAYPLTVTGLEARSSEIIDFKAENQPPEKMFKRLLRQLGEKNYAFEFKGQRLSRISVMPEAGAGAAPRPVPPRETPSVPAEDLVSVVRVDRVIDGSQAQDMGVQSNDLVIEYDGIKISQPGDLIREVKQKSDSPSVGMVLLRDGAPLQLTLAGGFIGIHIVPHKVPRETVAGYID